jgi:protein-L-isoaspartate(D-aspartate) O-methyltransferase
MTWGTSNENRRGREEMVKNQIERRGVKDKRVLEAMRKVPRELFIGQRDVRFAFCDGPLSIGHGQTISQPYIVAYMTDMLKLRSGDRVLEVGTGSGYQTAILAELAADVYTIEVIEDLSLQAQARLADQGYRNIHFRVGDGVLGWSEAAPFDGIMLTAAPDSVPEGLVDQLAVGGRMIAPVGLYEQYLELFVRKESGIDRRRLIGVRFVPMVSAARGGES